MNIEAPPCGTILAFDFGEKRIGVAVGNLELGLAHPLATVSDENTRKASIASSADRRVASGAAWQWVCLLMPMVRNMS